MRSEASRMEVTSVGWRETASRIISPSTVRSLAALLIARPLHIPNIPNRTAQV
jgi:hypothetical protein